MSRDIEGLPELVEEVSANAPDGTHAKVVLQLAQECHEYDLTPVEAWRREVGE